MDGVAATYNEHAIRQGDFFPTLFYALLDRVVRCA